MQAWRSLKRSQLLEQSWDFSVIILTRAAHSNHDFMSVTTVSDLCNTIFFLGGGHIKDNLQVVFRS
jgi:hypothetical protein